MLSGNSMRPSDRGYFTMWHYRQCSSDLSLSILPVVFPRRPEGPAASLQVLVNHDCFRQSFFPPAIQASRERQVLRLGDNLFERDGIRLNIQQEEGSLTGELTLSPFLSPKTSLIAPTTAGPLCYLGGLSCDHNILSLRHQVAGHIEINGRRQDISSQSGYLVRRVGSGSPAISLWYQCGDFQFNPSLSISVEVGTITVRGWRRPYQLVICHLDGTEYRMASYYGGLSQSVFSQNGEAQLSFRQRDLQLDIRVQTCHALPVELPQDGEMTGVCYLYPTCQTQVVLKKGNRILADDVGVNAGYQWSGEGHIPAAERSAVLPLSSEPFIKVGHVNDFSKKT